MGQQISNEPIKRSQLIKFKEFKELKEELSIIIRTIINTALKSLAKNNYNNSFYWLDKLFTIQYYLYHYIDSIYIMNIKMETIIIPSIIDSNKQQISNLIDIFNNILKQIKNDNLKIINLSEYIDYSNNYKLAIIINQIIYLLNNNNKVLISLPLHEDKYLDISSKDIITKFDNSMKTYINTMLFHIDNKNDGYIYNKCISNMFYICYLLKKYYNSLYFLKKSIYIEEYINSDKILEIKNDIQYLNIRLEKNLIYMVESGFPIHSDPKYQYIENKYIMIVRCRLEHLQHVIIDPN